MNSISPSAFGRLPRWFAVMARRNGWLAYVEFGALAALIATGVVSYLVLTGGEPGQRLLTPPLVALLLIANLIPAIALIVLAGRRIAMRRASNSPIGGHGRLHVRLVALFSLVASIPVLMLVIFASLLFQYGVEFWYSDRARSMFENANTLSQTFYNEKQERIVRETELMASDLSFNLSVAPIDSKAFNENFAYQVYVRELSEAANCSLFRKKRFAVACTGQPIRQAQPITGCRQQSSNSCEPREKHSFRIPVAGCRPLPRYRVRQTFTFMPPGSALHRHANRPSGFPLF
jgi:nitrogen fixation/metabolism regulation signal transduction histidine kinase